MTITATEIENRFAYQDEMGETCREIGKNIKEVAHLLNIRCPAGRELSLAITKLEEAAFWANAAIARYE